MPSGNRYVLKKDYGYNALGQRYTKSWKIVDLKNGSTLETGSRDNLGYGNQRVRDLNSLHKQEVQSANETQADREARESKFAKTLNELRGDIKEATAAEKAQARALSARQQGQLIRALRSVAVQQGGDVGSLEGIFQQIQEGGQRAVGDISRSLNVQELNALANLGKLELSTDLSLEDLALREERLTQEQSQFDQTMAMNAALTQLSLDQQPEWWESLLPTLATGVGTFLGSPAGGMAAGNFLQSVLGNVQYGLSDPSQPYITYG